MSQVIRIPKSTYKRLEARVKGFDTPANVIERLLDYYEKSENLASTKSHDSDKSPRNTSKYTFENHVYGKGRLVLAVIKAYVSNNPDTSFDTLQKSFPKHLQGSSGVFNLHTDAQAVYERTGHKRHFIKSDEIIKLSDCDVAVSTEWGKGNIDDFIVAAHALGYEITEEE